MIKIENRLAQPVVINQGKGRVLHLLAGARAIIDDADLETSEIRELIRRGVLAALAMGAEATARVESAPELPAAVVPLVVPTAAPVPTAAAEMLPDPEVAPPDAPGAPPAPGRTGQPRTNPAKPRKDE